jgi:hypothetical protein
MPRTWQPHQATQFARQLRLGQTYYYVNTHDTKHNPYEDSKTYSEVVFTDHLPFTKNPCTEYGASAHTLCQTFGPMYDAPPRGMRNLADPAPQYGAPLGNDYTGYLDEAEIRGLEKRVRSGSDPHTRPGRGGKPKKRSWF